MCNLQLPFVFKIIVAYLKFLNGQFKVSSYHVCLMCPIIKTVIVFAQRHPLKTTCNLFEPFPPEIRNENTTISRIEKINTIELSTD